MGSTGSIGRQTLDVVRRHPDRLRVAGLAAHRSVERFDSQVLEFLPAMACLTGDPTWTASAPTHALKGESGLIDLVTDPTVDLVVFASSGCVGFAPLLAALRARKQIVLANKEALVMAGSLVTKAALEAGIVIRPADSEHSAIWQCLQGEDASRVRSLTLTASGGPFRAWSAEHIATATIDDAMRHPTWRMGAKITIDSATLMNKGLELIEAHWLFAMPYDRIKVVVHPQSIIHSLVTFRDGSLKAQLGAPDMRTPIQYAVSWPDRWEPCEGPVFDLLSRPRLDFEEPDTGRFPCLRLARQAGEAAGTYPTVLCAADDVAVDAFSRGAISFPTIARFVEAVLDRHESRLEPNMEEILAADRWARRVAEELIPRVCHTA